MRHQLDDLINGLHRQVETAVENGRSDHCRTQAALTAFKPSCGQESGHPAISGAGDLPENRSQRNWI